MPQWYQVATAALDSLAMLFLVFQLLEICKVKQAVLKRWANKYTSKPNTTVALSSGGPESPATPNTTVSTILSPQRTLRTSAYLVYTRIIQCLTFPLTAFSSFTPQRKLRFMAVFSCLFAKLFGFFNYLPIVEVLPVPSPVVYSAMTCLYSIFLFSSLTLSVFAGIDRYMRINLICISTSSYSRWQWLRIFLAVYTILVIVSNFFYAIINSISSTDGFRLRFLVLNVFYLILCITLDTYTNVKMVRAAIIVNINMFSLQQKTPVLLSLHKTYIARLRRTLYLYLSATIMMDIVAICIFFIGSTVFSSYGFELNHLAASWITIRIYIFFKYLNAVFNATKLSRKPILAPNQNRVDLIPSSNSRSLNTVQSYQKKFGGGGNQKSVQDEITGGGAILNSNLQASQEYSYHLTSWNSQSFSINSAVPGSSIHGSSHSKNDFAEILPTSSLDHNCRNEQDLIKELSRIHEDSEE